MSPMLERAHQLVFGSHVSEGSGQRGRIRAMDVNLIVMSRETFRELLREDFNGYFARMAMAKDQPDRCGPARVAYDDSMQLGQMIVAEGHGDTGQ